jgi:hypothetical protein
MTLNVRGRSEPTVQESCHPERSGEAAIKKGCHSERRFLEQKPKSKNLRFSRCAAKFFCVAALCAACAHAQATEQTETGRVQTKHGMRDYTIRLLPLAAFPSIPQSVAAQLNAMHCMIPQTFEAHHPENVIHGAFAGRGTNDWAMLCSHDGSTDLLVFFQNAPQKPFTLATHNDSERTGSETPYDKLGSAWGITAIPPDGMMHTPGVHQHGPFDHYRRKQLTCERKALLLSLCSPCALW